MSKQTRLGDTVKRYRQAMGLNSVELSRNAGFCDSYVSNIETGENSKPRGSSVIALATALHIEPSILFETLEEPESKRERITGVDQRIYDEGNCYVIEVRIPKRAVNLNLLDGVSN